MEFCQSIVDYASFGGDSGAPVFKYYPETNTALLLGIHTGRYNIKGGATVSSLANIEYDFGFSIVF
jgi:V8-like Glu-specific endopeptidase